jgi:hypothetical protein
MLQFSPRNKILQKAIRDFLINELIGDDGIPDVKKVVVHHVTDFAIGALQVEYEMRYDSGKCTFHRTILT